MVLGCNKSIQFYPIDYLSLISKPKDHVTKLHFAKVCHFKALVELNKNLNTFETTMYFTHKLDLFFVIT